MRLNERNVDVVGYFLSKDNCMSNVSIFRSALY